MEEHIYQRYIGQGFNLQNILRTHMTQHQGDKQSNWKMGKGPESTLLQVGYTDGP